MFRSVPFLFFPLPSVLCTCSCGQQRAVYRHKERAKGQQMPYSDICVVKSIAVLDTNFDGLPLYTIIQSVFSGVWWYYVCTVLWVQRSKPSHGKLMLCMFQFLHITSRHCYPTISKSYILLINNTLLLCHITRKH